MKFSFTRFWKLGTFAVLSAFICVDVAALRSGGDTFSEFVLEAARENPVIPLLVGAVLGHLFWPQFRD